jgi:hypothetical protein
METDRKAVIVGAGAAQVVHPDLLPGEVEALRRSASVIAKAIGEARGKGGEVGE